MKEKNIQWPILLVLAVAKQKDYARNHLWLLIGYYTWTRIEKRNIVQPSQELQSKLITDSQWTIELNINGLPENLPCGFRDHPHVSP